MYGLLRKNPRKLASGWRWKLRCWLADKPVLRELCYILDEPTTGLHAADIERLMLELRRLTEAGATVMVVEHDLQHRPERPRHRPRTRRGRRGRQGRDQRHAGVRRALGAWQDLSIFTLSPRYTWFLPELNRSGSG
jgi:energy-coupling factor transporter ATP-binding protein EcfA2